MLASENDIKFEILRQLRSDSKDVGLFMWRTRNLQRAGGRLWAVCKLRCRENTSRKRDLEFRWETIDDTFQQIPFFFSNQFIRNTS
jgi:hypothetical protein